MSTMNRWAVRICVLLLLLMGGMIVNVAAAFGDWLATYYASDARWAVGPFSMGWPMASLESEHSRFFPGVDHVPQFPIWPGFAINTLFYAAVLWGMFAGVSGARRRWRRGRGLCPKCAYDLRGVRGRVSADQFVSVVCPECGETSCLFGNPAHD